MTAVGQRGAPQRPDWRAMSESAGLAERDLRAACRRRRYGRGETIFHEGDPGAALHLLDIGRVSVRLTTPRGDIAIVDVLRPGDAFGEQALLDSWGERTATVVAMERVETLALDVHAFHDVRTASTAFDRFLLAVLSNRLRLTNHQLLEARFVPADQRVHRCLLRLLDTFDGASIPLTQSDVASMAGVTRSTANRQLRRAQLDGVIDIRRGRITVVDRDALERRSGMEVRERGS